MGGVITLMADGAVLYAGSVDSENCTGFVFQGYVDTTPLDSAAHVDANDADENELNTVSPNEEDGDGDDGKSTTDDENMVLIGVCIGVGICALLVIATSILMGCRGYSVAKKPKVSAMTYELMDN